MKIAINGISILSTLGYDGFKEIIPAVTESWWLKMPLPLSSRLAICSPIQGKRMLDAINKELALGVRPILFLSCDTQDFKPQDKILLFGISWTILKIDHEVDTMLVLCDEIIAYRRFDDKSCHWDSSELNAWLEEWLEYVTLGLDDVVYKK